MILVSGNCTHSISPLTNKLIIGLYDYILSQVWQLAHPFHRTECRSSNPRTTNDVKWMAKNILRNTSANYPDKCCNRSMTVPFERKKGVGTLTSVISSFTCISLMSHLVSNFNHTLNPYILNMTCKKSQGWIIN